MKVLVVAPHPDDEILGCGGIIAKNVKEGNEVYVCITTDACEPLFSKQDYEIDKKQIRDSHSYLGVNETCFLHFPAAMLDSVPKYQINDAFCKLIKQINPDEVYIPHRGDMHIDHKIVVDACMVALRPRSKKNVKRIYAYETLSETDWDIPNAVNAFIPNVYVDITKYIDKKVKAMEKYKNQICEYPNPRSAEGIKALAMHRGSTVSVNYAEAFMLIREIK